MDVLASGTVISAKNKPIEFKLGPENDYIKVILNFEITDDKDKQRIDGKVIDKRTLEVTFTAIVKSLSGVWTEEPLSLGLFNYRKLYLNIHVFIQGKDDPTLLHYTFYLGEQNTPPSSLGCEISK